VLCASLWLVLPLPSVGAKDRARRTLRGTEVLPTT